MLIIFFITLANNIAICEAVDSSKIQQQINTYDENEASNGGIFGEPQRYLLIKKELVPYKQIYLPNDDITIYVEIKPLKYRDMTENLTNIHIYELIDSNLSIVGKTKKGIITENLDDINKYRNNPKSMDSFTSSNSKLIDFSLINNYGELYIEKMNSWERLLYSYTVKPKSPGTFSTNTIARTSYFSDIDQKLKLDVNNVGLYAVDIVPSKNKVFQKEPFQIYYTITYLGDGQTSAIIDFENAENKPYNYDRTYKQRLDFTSKYESHLIPLNVSYSKKGSFTLPGILIDGSLSIYDNTIIVDSFFERYWQFLQLIILISTIIGGAFTFIKYGTGKFHDGSYSLYKFIEDVLEDINGFIGSIPVRTFTILGSLLTAFAVYIILCALYPGEFISAYVFVIDHWVGLEILFLAIFVYIICIIFKINLITHNENYWFKWFLAFIMICFWLLLIVIAVNFTWLVEHFHMI
jgi:hypothetical protein